jgi:hypothetical protein
MAGSGPLQDRCLADNQLEEIQLVRGKGRGLMWSRPFFLRHAATSVQANENKLLEFVTSR